MVQFIPRSFACGLGAARVALVLAMITLTASSLAVAQDQQPSPPEVEPTTTEEAESAAEDDDFADFSSFDDFDDFDSFDEEQESEPELSPEEAARLEELENSPSRITDEVIPFQGTSLPRRPAPLFELGDPLFESGAVSNGFTLPTGATWQPSFLLFGTYRTAFQTIETRSDRRLTEWANRLDLFGNLYLTPTERILVGLRPLDEGGRFTRYTYSSNDISARNEFEDEFNANINTLFFEGDFGELFPLLDESDSGILDYGITVGRQPITYQDGLLINDFIDALGVSKINLKPSWAVNYRTSVLWSWHELNRVNLSSQDSSAFLLGWLNEIDFRATTLEFDAVYVDSENTGDGFYGGIGATQRFGRYNTTFRALASLPTGDETLHNSEGYLFFSELSFTPHGTQHVAYANSFIGRGDYQSASRDPAVGGPLGAVGLLFSSVQLGRFTPALGNTVGESFGGALGYQFIFNDQRTQLTFEAGGRSSTQSTGQRAVAGAMGFQTAIGSRFIFRVDGFASYGRDRVLPGDTDDEFGYGGRAEWVVQG